MTMSQLYASMRPCLPDPTDGQETLILFISIIPECLESIIHPKAVMLDVKVTCEIPGPGHPI